MGITIGIDLGTSNSVVALMGPDGPKVLLDGGGKNLQPSVVALGSGEQPVVGQVARQQLNYAPDTTIASVKRLIGRRYNDEETQRLRTQVGWGISEGENGDARLRVRGTTYTAQEMSAHILTHMVGIAERSTGEKVENAVITVPAYFNDHQRQATRDAATIANVNCIRIINEPTAAAMAYGYHEQKNQRIVVYDLGGGTFDVSVLHLGDDLIEVVSTAGDTFLGGDDFDAAIAAHIRNTHESTGGSPIPTSHEATVRLMQAAEKLKHQLGESQEASIKIPGLARTVDGAPEDVDAGLNRVMAHKICMPMIQRTFVVCDDALAQAGLSPAQIDGIVLVGGMTRFPIIKDAVGQYFGEEPIDYINPDEVVALGAAIQGSRLTEVSEEPAPVLLDVTSQTLGVATVGGFIEPLIARNTPIPTMASKVFHTAKDNQTQVKIRVHQGDEREARRNYMLGDFVLEGLPEGPRGHARVRVTFNIDSNGMVNVTATSSGTGATKEIRVEATSSLTADQVEELRFSQQQSASENSGAVEPVDSDLGRTDLESESLDLD